MSADVEIVSFKTLVGDHAEAVEDLFSDHESSKAELSRMHPELARWEREAAKALVEEFERVVRERDDARKARDSWRSDVMNHAAQSRGSHE